jgi:tetratricopeptide (TPR) repeat protein
MPEQILEDWLLHCAALLHEVHHTDDTLQRAIRDMPADQTPLESARRLVAVWLASQRELVSASPHEADWLHEAELLCGHDDQLLIGMMLCLLGAYRQALPRLQAATLPPWAQVIALVWRARATQRLGDHAGALLLWDAVRAQAVQCPRGRPPCADDADRARAALVCGDLESANALAGRLVCSDLLEPAGRAVQLQCLVQTGRHAEAVSMAQAWAMSARTADNTWAALHALAWLGQDDAIEAGWTDACNRLDPREMQRLDMRMPELLAMVGRRAAGVRVLRRPGAAAGGCVPAQVRLAVLLARDDHHDLDVLREVDAASLGTLAESGEDKAWALFAMGEAQRRLGRMVPAMRHFQQACASAGSWWMPRWALGELLLCQGRVTEAIDNLSHAVELAALQHGLVLVALRPLPDDAALQADLVQCLADVPLAPELRQCLRTALGAAALRQGAQRPGLAHLEAAAAVPAGASQAWRPAAHRAWVDDILATFTRQRVDAWSGWGCSSLAPVFVVGLPEAGQAAVRAVLRSVPGWHVLDDEGMVAAEIGRVAQQDRGFGIVRTYPECVDEIVAADAWRIANRWLQAMALAAPGAAGFVDIGSRAEHVGFIKLVFPRARIVWCCREPYAQALALHANETLPRTGQLAWMQRLQWIGAQWVDQQRLMAHWQRLYGTDILAVPFEGLCETPHTWVAALAVHLGLPSGCQFVGSATALRPLLRHLAVDRSDPQLAQLTLALRCQPLQPLPRPLPELQPGLLHRARMALDTGQPLRAELDLRRLLEVMPDHAAGHYLLGQALARREQPLAAWMSMRQGTALQPQQRRWLQAMMQLQHAVLAAGIDHALLLLAGPQPDSAAPLVSALQSLQRATAGAAPPPPDIAPQYALQQAMQALVSAGLPAWPVLSTLQDLQSAGSLLPQRRQAFLAVPALQMEAVTGRLQRLGLALRHIDAGGGRLLIWPAHRFSLILMPSEAGDTALTAVSVGALQCLVPLAAMLGLNRLDMIVLDVQWRQCEALQLWLATRVPAGPQATGASALRAADAADTADAAMDALHAWLQ